MRNARRHVLTLYAIGALACLLVPIAVVFLFSLNDPAGRFNYTWQGFTLANWTNWDATPGLRDSIVTSLEIGILATLVATALGTLVAIAIVRYRFWGRRGTSMLVLAPITSPEVVLGASLLTLFLGLNVVTGIPTIFVAHVMFIISYVVVIVSARLVGLNRELEEAAMDLGATEWMAFRKVTLPLLGPAIASAGLLGFAISLDDFVVTYFVAGSETTFPLFVWGAARVSIPPQVNVVATAIFMVAVALAAASAAWQRHHERRTSGAL